LNVELALPFSVLIGLLLGLLGGGGSILTVPVLVYALQVEPKTAILTSFVVVGLSSLTGIVQHARKRHVCWKSGLLFGFSGMSGAFAGGLAAGRLSSDILMAAFGLVTLATGLAMLRGQRPQPSPPATMPAVTECPEKIKLPRILFDGFFVGALTGLVGVGGGFLIVPALTLLLGLPMHAAVGTSLLVIVMNAAAGMAGYANHANLDLSLTVIFAGGAILGSWIGGYWSVRMGATQLRRAFGWFVLLIAGYVLYQSITLELLQSGGELLLRHQEFAFGILSATALFVLGRLAAWLHRSDRDGQSSPLAPTQACRADGSNSPLRKPRGL
jgi:uncharacterized protein